MPDAFLNKLGRWAEFSPADRLLLAQLSGEPVALNRGAPLMAGPDGAQRSILMLDGWAARCKESANGQRVINELLMPGDLHRYTRHRDPSASMVMLSAGNVLLLSPATLASLDAHPTIGTALEWATTVQQSIHSEWLINIGKNKVHARVAHLLCEIAVRMNNAGLLDNGTCAMPLTQSDIADVLSTTLVHVNIALQRLRAENLVRLDQKKLTILDREGLEAIAQFDDRYLMRWPTALPDRRGRNAQHRIADRRRSSRA